MRGLARASQRSRAFLVVLLVNLAHGCRLACGLPRPRFTVSLGQLLALLAVGWVCAFAADWRGLGEDPVQLSAWGLASDAARGYWWLLAVAVVALLDGAPRGFLRLAVPCAAADPLLWGAWLLADAATPALAAHGEGAVSEVLWWTMLAWQGFVMARALRLVHGRFRWRIPALAACYGAALYVVAERTPDTALLEASVARRSPAPLDVEGTYYAQSALLDRALAQLGEGRPGRPDFWFLGFGAYAGEAVFRREVTQVREIVAAEFDTAARSLLLVNSRRTLARHPLANRSNLDYVLRRLGARMERDEDILFLFLTSHGREDGKLVVDFGELGLRDLPPEDLRRMLDEARIRWRVLIVSACFSGAFLPALQGPDTLIITAAAADRSSFGCAHENRWTYFGEAFFRDALPASGGLGPAFEAARDAIDRRERKEGKDPSQPQMAAGADIERQLARWQALRR